MIIHDKMTKWKVWVGRNKANYDTCNISQSRSTARSTFHSKTKVWVSRNKANYDTCIISKSRSTAWSPLSTRTATVSTAPLVEVNERCGSLEGGGRASVVAVVNYYHSSSPTASQRRASAWPVQSKYSWKRTLTITSKQTWHRDALELSCLLVSTFCR